MSVIFILCVLLLKNSFQDGSSEALKHLECVRAPHTAAVFTIPAEQSIRRLERRAEGGGSVSAVFLGFNEPDLLPQTESTP